MCLLEVSNIVLLSVSDERPVGSSQEVDLIFFSLLLLIKSQLPEVVSQQVIIWARLPDAWILVLLPDNDADALWASASFQLENILGVLGLWRTPPGIRRLFIVLISVASIFSFRQVPLAAGGLTGGSCCCHPYPSVS